MLRGGGRDPGRAAESSRLGSSRFAAVSHGMGYNPTFGTAGERTRTACRIAMHRGARVLYVCRKLKAINSHLSMAIQVVEAKQVEDPKRARARRGSFVWGINDQPCCGYSHNRFDSYWRWFNGGGDKRHAIALSPYVRPESLKGIVYASGSIRVESK